ncbi:MAG: ABC transporter permease [Acidobacteriota bacterium]|nr:ABC transporter permease [Blastocatellia bacterium]MDW8239464.1 ABC transporter permease [Acidobacteriota bacterium]
MNLTRVGALVMRYVFVYRRNKMRLVELFFWPLVDLLVWGYLTIFIQQTGQGALPRFITFLIGAMIFWDLLYRSQQGVTVSFLEDVWSRNLFNVFCAPVRLSEYIVGTFLVGLLRVGITLIPLLTLAWGLYHFNILDVGFWLIPFIVNLLVLGLTLGIVATALIIRYGDSVQVLAWAVPFFFQPFSAVFYPVDVLPSWMQAVAYALPSTYVFEGMRAVIQTGASSWQLLLMATGMNVAYLLLAMALLRRMFNLARDRGLLGKLGIQ